MTGDRSASPVTPIGQAVRVDGQLVVGAGPLHAVGLADLGLRRVVQEDALHVGGDLLVIADGLGGHAGGEVASAAAVRAVRDALAAWDGDPVDGALAAVQGAHWAVVEAARAAGTWGAGSTIAFAWLQQDQLLVVHAGDSRVGWCDEAGLRWLTEDHNEAAELVALGELTVEEAYALGLQHSLARCLGGGFAEPTVPDIRSLPRSAGRLLLCSDGLCGYVEDAAVEQALRAAASPEVAVHELDALALAVGAPDNVTVIVADLA
jgi:serine/threonine protein phosphatase PrpC